MAAAEELSTNLSSYKLQLRQVEAALTTQSKNEELLALQQNLQEVIDLTLELIAQSKGSLQPDSTNPSLDWSVGDACVALWSEDGEYYDGIIQEITADGRCLVQFNEVDVTDTTPISTLQRPGSVSVKKSQKRADYQVEDVPSTSLAMEHRLATKTKHDQLKAQIEAKKKKRAKYNEKIKEVEQVREREAHRWKSFQNKAAKKTYSGLTKKSIFATSEEVEGRVGVGTCGISGKPMTKDALPAVGKTAVVKKTQMYNPRTN